jgi:hypothetical protein
MDFVYSGWSPPPSDVYVPAPRRQGPRRAVPPAIGWAQRRRAQPVNVLLLRTVKWIASLPPNARPKVLAGQFARIANQLCADWHDAPVCRAYLEDLLLDRRSGRQGFAPQIAAELAVLRELHAAMFPHQTSVWDAVGHDG